MHDVQGFILGEYSGNLSITDTIGPRFLLVIQRFSFLRGKNVFIEVDLLGPKFFMLWSGISLIQGVL